MFCNFEFVFTLGIDTRLPLYTTEWAITPVIIPARKYVLLFGVLW